MKVARELKPEGILIVNLSGRGDKDVESVRDNWISTSPARDEMFIVPSRFIYQPR